MAQGGAIRRKSIACASPTHPILTPAPALAPEATSADAGATPSAAPPTTEVHEEPAPPTTAPPVATAVATSTANEAVSDATTRVTRCRRQPHRAARTNHTRRSRRQQPTRPTPTRTPSGPTTHPRMTANRTCRRIAGGARLTTDALTDGRETTDDESRILAPANAGDFLRRR